MSNYTDTNVFEYNCNIFIEQINRNYQECFKFIENTQEKTDHKLKNIQEFLNKKSFFDIFSNIFVELYLHTDKNITIKITKDTIYINHSNIDNFFNDYKNKFIYGIKNCNFVFNENLLIELQNILDTNLNNLFFEKIRNYSKEIVILSNGYNR